MWFAYVDESFNGAQHWVVAVLIEHSNVNEAQRAIRAVVAEAAATYGIRRMQSYTDTRSSTVMATSCR